MSEFVRFANAIGRYLLFRSGPLCVVDAMGPAPGLVGRFFLGRGGPKYFKGAAAPGLGDLAYRAGLPRPLAPPHCAASDASAPPVSHAGALDEVGRRPYELNNVGFAPREPPLPVAARAR